MVAERVFRIGLVGAGSMGALHARVVAGSPNTELVWVADPDRAIGETVAARYQTRWLREPDLDSVDGVVVAAPTHLHHGIAAAALDAGVALLVEKPLADSMGDTIDLIDRARRRGAVMMCGLLERFNPAVRTAAEIAREPIHVATVRHSPYASRIATGVAGDLLIHDVDLVVRLMKSSPISVLGTTASFEPRSRPGSEDVAEAMLQFAGGGVASLSASRVAQRKVRSLTIAELGRVIEVDLLRQDITVYRHVQGNEFDEDAGYSHQTIIDIPVVRFLGEPLQLQLQHFVGLLDGSIDPHCDLDGVLTAHAVVDAVVSDARLRNESDR